MKDMTDPSTFSVFLDHDIDTLSHFVFAYLFIYLFIFFLSFLFFIYLFA